MPIRPENETIDWNGTALSMLVRGMFAVYKPSGMTSAAVTNTLKKTLLQVPLPTREVGSREAVDCREAPPGNDVTTTGPPVAGERRGRNAKRLKLGHGGTLDSMAEGVLVVALGEDCRRLAGFLAGDKCYEAGGELGRSTDTLWHDGTVTDERPYAHVTREDLKCALESFVGEIHQTPPVYSALKLDGRRLSDWARQGVIVSPQSRRVTIHSLALLEFESPRFKISVSCSSGTYVRSLVRDIGLRVGSVAHMVHLCRTKQGPFTQEGALRRQDWTMEGMQQAVHRSAVLLQSV